MISYSGFFIFVDMCKLGYGYGYDARFGFRQRCSALPSLL